ncbi:MAG TPA: glycoside hydrolase family 3 N-terminal domain-containing protein [Gemmatimonadaceae bacterium]|nr:glycoside hydrolase family 3 N-terminal domain-containing protein [Gemmatimonadaceae bacterium]
MPASVGKVIAVSVAVSGVLGCAPRAAAARVESTPYTLSPPPWVESTLARMTLRQKAAQMVWPRTFGEYLAADAEEWRRLERDAREDSVGGFIISVGSPAEIASTANALQRASDVPLLVGADLEAGAGFRARGGYYLANAIDLGGAPLFPPNMAMGAAALGALAAGADSATAARMVYEEARATAAEGRALGIHVAFAPVLDVNNNPANPVINTRSYGADPRLVAWLGAAFVRGLQSDGAAGMVATAKHFPGHGDTDVNSHLALPVVGASRARLDSVELVPFRAAIGAGVGAVMSFHGAVTAIDPSGDPATLSAPALTGLLRHELGFRGLVVSDAMDMRGVLDKYGAEEAVKRAVAAGADVLIQPDSVRQAIDAIVAGVAAGRYTEAHVDSSARRILDLKWRMGLDRRRRFVSLDSIRAVVGDSAHEALAREAAARAMTVVRDSFALVPMRRLNAGARVLSVTIARRYDLPAGTAFDAELGKRFPALRRELVVVDDASPSSPPPDYWRLLRAADSADVTIVGVYATQNWDAASAGRASRSAEFVRQLAERGARPMVVAFGNPYLLRDCPTVAGYLAAWGGSPLLQRAAAHALLGDAPVTGRLPIDIPGVAALGTGLSR